MRRFRRGLILATALWPVLSVCTAVLADDEYRVTPISAWCATPDVFDQVVTLEEAEGEQAVIDYLNAEFALGVCRRGRWAFIAQEIVREYTDREEMVLRGTINTGREVFVWIDSELYPVFLKPGADT